MPEVTFRRRLRRFIPRPVRQRLYEWSPSRRLRWRRAPGTRRVPSDTAAALTFDDGPDPDCTPELLDVMDRLGISATFFVIGERVAEHPAIAREIADRGHELGLHGMTHRRHDRLDEQSAREDLARGLGAIEDAAGYRPLWYRPPFGASSPSLASICDQLGLRLAYWSAWGQDWEEISAQRIADLVLRDLAPGAVILLHDSALYAQRDDPKPTVDSVPQIADAAKRRGLGLLSLSAALDETGR